ncbi:MAG: TadE/TadG family type IV pilus assembly protein [Chloroflexota bacterium]
MKIEVFPITNHGHQASSEKGQSFIEVGLSLIILITLLLGTVDASLMVLSLMALTDASEEGAMYGAINPTDTAGIVTRVRTHSSFPIDLSDTTNVAVQITISGEACSGHTITVDVTYNHPIITPFMGGLIGSQIIPLSASATNVIFRPECP